MNKPQKIKQDINKLIAIYESELSSPLEKKVSFALKSHPWLRIFLKSIKTEFESLNISEDGFFENRSNQWKLLSSLKSFHDAIQNSYIATQKSSYKKIPRELKRVRNEDLLSFYQRLFDSFSQLSLNQSFFKMFLLLAKKSLSEYGQDFEEYKVLSWKQPPNPSCKQEGQTSLACEQESKKSPLFIRGTQGVYTTKQDLEKLYSIRAGLITNLRFLGFKESLIKEELKN